MAWYAILDDLIGGWAIGNRDAPMSEYDFRRGTSSGDCVLAAGMVERDASAIAALLNLHDYPEQPRQEAV